MFKLFLLVTGLLVMTTAATSSSVTAAPPDCNSITRGRYHALVCWLWSIQIHLPGEKITEEVFTVTLESLICTNFEVTSTNSSFIPSSSNGAKRNPSLQIDLMGISATCRGNFTWSGLGSGSGSVVASANSVSDTNGPLHLEIDVASAPLSVHVKNFSSSSYNHNSKKASLPFPTLVTLSSCHSNFIVHDVQFSGSVSAKIIGLFSKVISNKLTVLLNRQFCSLIKNNGEKAVDEAFHAAGEYLGGLILHSSEGNNFSGCSTSTASTSLAVLQRSDNEELHRNIEKRDGNGNVSWDTDMPLLQHILLGINNFIRDHMNEGIILKTLQRYIPSVCDDCGFFFKGFNGMVNTLTKGTGTLDFAVPETIFALNHNHTFEIPLYGNVTISAQTMTVSGVNNLTHFSLLRPSDQNILSSSIASEAGLHFTIFMVLEVTPTSGGAFQGDTLNESFEIQFNMSNVNFTASFMLEFEREVLDKLTVGSFIHGSYTTFDKNRNIMNCVLEALSSITLSDMSGRMGLDKIIIAPAAHAEGTSAETSLEEDIDEVMNNMIQLLLLEYPYTVTESLASLIQIPARALVNAALSKYMGDFKELPLHCVNIEKPPNAVERPFRFDENVYLWIFDNIFGGENMIGTANVFIDCVASLLTQNSSPLSFRFGDINVEFFNLALANFGSIHELDLLLPEVDHYHIKNRFVWGKSCNVTLSFGMNLTHPQLSRIGTMNVKLNLKNLVLNAGTELRYDMNYLPNLQVTDLLAHPQCYAIPVTNFGFYDFNMTVEMFELNIDAILDSGNDGQTRKFSYKTADPTKSAIVANRLMSEVAVQLQQYLERLSIIELNGASSVCTTLANPNRSYDSNHSVGAAAGAWTLLIVIVFVAFNAWMFMKGFKSLALHSDKCENTISLTEPLLGGYGESRDDNHDEIDDVMEVESPRPRKVPFSSSTSLMYHSSIDKTLTFGFPVVLALTIILLLSSNLSIGASVDLQVTNSDGQKLTPLINIYEFSLSSTLGEMLQAQVYMLMLLIWFCSGVWPFIKLVLMLFCWITSARRLPLIKREKVLYLLDSLQKFSLIDTYVLVIMMVAFRYNLEASGIGSLDVYVTPKYGFYSFLLATIISLFSGHVMLFCHRRSTLPVIPVYSGYESLSRHVFDDKHGRGLLKMTKRFRRIVVFLLILAFILIVTGANLHSFSFTYNGVAGVALGDSRVRDYSLVSMGELISQSVQTASIGINWIKTTYFFSPW